MVDVRRAVVVALVATGSVGGAYACSTQYKSNVADAADAGTDVAAVDAANANDAAKEGDSAPADASMIDSPEVFSFISPSDVGGALVLATTSSWIIATDPPVLVRYTTNGADPSDAGTSAMSPVTIDTPDAGTVIQWTAGGGGHVRSFVVNVDAGLQGNAGFLASGFRFTKSVSPIVHAQPGEVLTGTVALATEWNEATAVNAIDQITYGFGDASIDCLVDYVPPVYPGRSSPNTALSVVAPQTPGTYYVELGFARQLKCKPDAINNPLRGPAVGVIVVD